MRKGNHLIIGITLLILLSVSMQYAVASNSDSLNVTFSYYAPYYDINNDGVVNYLDVSSLVSHYGNIVPTRPRNASDYRYDINGDGIVNYLDVSSLVSHYGERWLVSHLDDAKPQPSQTYFGRAVEISTALASSIIRVNTLIYDSGMTAYPLIALFLFAIGVSLLRLRNKRRRV